MLGNSTTILQDHHGFRYNSDNKGSFYWRILCSATLIILRIKLGMRNSVFTVNLVLYPSTHFHCVLERSQTSQECRHRVYTSTGDIPHSPRRSRGAGEEGIEERQSGPAAIDLPQSLSNTVQINLTSYI